ncbi:MAG: oligosaccharide flippase family protein, partial [Terriglobales bacterium]
VLTRWIGPHAYGLFVTALGLTSFLALLSRGGIDTYLVRAESPPDERTYSVATTLVMGLAIALLGAGAAVVPLLTRWYGSREFLPAYLVTLLTIPLAALAGVPTAKLERDLNFRAVASIELGGQILALLVSVTLAWRGLGVWAPVAGLIVWQAWAATGALMTAKLALRPAFDAAEARRMLSFGIGYTASLRVWQLRTLVNPLLVGRFAGAEAVALVALAMRIAEGLGFIRVAAGRLAIAALSRLRHDPLRFQLTLERALRLQILALGPLLCLFALAAPVVVPRLLGSRWTASLQVYPFVAAGVLVNSVYNLQASALFVAGQQWIVLRAHALHVALLGVGTLLLLPRLGILGYGWAEVAACGAYAVLHVAARRMVCVSYRKLGWLTSAFSMPPFALLMSKGWGAALWIPLFALASLEVWKRISRDQNGTFAADVGRAVPSVVPSVSSMRSKLSNSGA